MTERRLHALPLLFACAALAIASHTPGPPLIIIVFTLGAMLLPVRLPLDPATQRLAMVVLLILTVAGIRASSMPLRGPHLGAFGYGLALAPLVMAATRAWFERPEGGHRVDVALAFVTMFTVGAARPGPIPYAGAFVTFVAIVLAVQRADDPHRTPLAELSPRARRFTVTLVTLSIASSLGLLGFAVVAHRELQKRFQHAFESAYQAEMGISESAWIGGLSPLLKSNEVVLRVTGSPIERLRGVVLDEYGGGRWTRAQADEALVQVQRERPEGSDVIEIRHVAPDRDLAFLPLDAHGVATPSGMLRGDPLGVVRRAKDNGSPRLWFRLGPRDAFRPSSPRREDLAVPRSVRAVLGPIATEWTRATTAQEGALEALQLHLLGEYTYSLDPLPASRQDPVIDFLVSARKGSCEHFASAFALMARSLGIPTRLVLGYRVAERNPYGDHFVVRKKNAHAWVEAYLPSGRWETFDPTPMAELPQDRPHTSTGADAILEAIAAAWEHAEAWLAARTIIELGTTALLGVVVFAWQRWRRARKEARPARDGALAFDATPEGFLRLERMLAARGFARSPNETLERWTDRLNDSELASVVRRYAELRYGGLVTKELEAELSATARGMAKTPWSWPRRKSRRT